MYICDKIYGVDNLSYTFVINICGVDNLSCTCVIQSVESLI